MMKRLALVILVLSFGFGSISQLAAQDKQAKDDKKEEVKQDVRPVAKEVKSGKAFNTVCPVSSEDIDDPVLVEYNGKVYGVCCKSCLKKFIKDPEKYISRLSSDGKSLTKK
jgi:YHS domain-containing protein